MTKEATERVGRNNNFNFIRLTLALLVLLSHSPELVDGNRKRELLTMVFHTVSFGEVAVDGFFLLSGFLLIQSWQRSPVILDFLAKRVLRIYPGFIIASLICALVVGPLGSMSAAQYFGQFHIVSYLKGLLILNFAAPQSFPSHHYTSINGALWTIPYEFRCYLFLVALGLCGAVKQRWFWLGVAVVISVIALAPSLVGMMHFRGSVAFFHDPVQFFHFTMFFCAGGYFSLFRDRVTYKTAWCMPAAVILFVSLFNIITAQLALATLGAYLLFALAFAHIPALESFEKRADISYGVYLYGWPMQQLTLWYLPHISPWLMFVLASSASAVCGWISWTFIEHPCLRLKPRSVRTT